MKSRYPCARHLQVDCEMCGNCEPAGDQRAGQQPSAEPRCPNKGFYGQCVLQEGHRNKHGDTVRHSWGVGDLPTGEDAKIADGVFSVGAVPTRPPVSAEFESLLDKASAAKGTPENIEGWSKRIAQDVCVPPVSALRERLEKLIENWKTHREVSHGSYYADELAAALKAGPETPDA